MAAEGGAALGAAQSGGRPSGLVLFLLLVPVVDDLLEPGESREYDGETRHVHGGAGGARDEGCAHLSLLSSSGISCLSRAVSVCMNLLKGVSFLRPADDEDRPVRGRAGGSVHSEEDEETGARTLLGLCSRAVGGLGRCVDHRRAGVGRDDEDGGGRGGAGGSP